MMSSLKSRNIRLCLEECTSIEIVSTVRYRPTWLAAVQGVFALRTHAVKRCRIHEGKTCRCVIGNAVEVGVNIHTNWTSILSCHHIWITYLGVFAFTDPAPVSKCNQIAVMLTQCTVFGVYSDVTFLARFMTWCAHSIVDCLSFRTAHFTVKSDWISASWINTFTCPPFTFDNHQFIACMA